MRRSTHERLPWAAAPLALLAAIALMLAVAAAAHADPKLHECQHPTTTGEEAFHLHHVDVHVACKVVRKLGAWLYKDHHVDRLYHCDRPAPDQAGTPVLNLHTFAGWKLEDREVGRLRDVPDSQLVRGHRDGLPVELHVAGPVAPFERLYVSYIATRAAG